MVKAIVIEKRRQGPQGPSRRSLRRAIRPVRGRIGWRVVVFVILLSLVVGAIGIWLNLKLETWEREHAAMQHTR